MLPERGARRAKTFYDMIRGEASTLLGFCEYTDSSIVSPLMHCK